MSDPFTALVDSFHCYEHGVPHIVNPDGSFIVDDTDYSAPETLYAVDSNTLEGSLSNWNILSGYSNQHGYDGPIMHESEIPGESMLEKIMEKAGQPISLAIVTVCDYESSEPIGWAILSRPSL